MLNSCGDNVVETKSATAAIKDETATINVHVRNGAGGGAFKASDNVYVTLAHGNNAPKLVGDGSFVSYSGLNYGTYEIKVEKEGYAAAFYTTTLDPYDPENPAYSGSTYTGGNRSVSAVLYPLTAGISGTLTYETPTNATAPAAGATVLVTVDINRSSASTERGIDAKLEHSVFSTTTGSDGSFSLTGLPAVGATINTATSPTVTVTAVGKAFGDLKYTDANITGLLPSGLLPGTDNSPSVLTVGIAYPKSLVGKHLLLIGPPAPTVSGSESIELTFDEDLEGEGTNLLGTGVIVVNAGAAGPAIVVTEKVEGKKITITPKKDWAIDAPGGLLVITVNDLRSKLGNSYSRTNGAVDNRIQVQIAEDDATGTLEIINVARDGFIWLTDSSKNIVLEFNRDIEKDNLDRLNLVSGQAHSVSISENTVTITPAAGAWDKKKIEAAQAGGAPSVLTLGALKSVTGGSYSLATPKIKFFDGTSPDFTVLKDSKWFKDTLVLELADTSKTIEFTLSENIGDPPSGTVFRAYQITGASFSDRKSLESTFSGNKISIKPNPTWPIDVDVQIILENVVSGSGEFLSGGDKTVSPLTGLPTDDEYARVWFAIRKGRPLYVLTQVVKFPATFSSDSIVVKFSEAIDTAFIKGKILVYKDHDPVRATAVGYTNTAQKDTQLVVVTVASDRKSIAIKPVGTEKWVAGDLTVELKAGSAADAVKSTEGVKLDADNSAGTKAFVFTEKASTSTSIATASVSNIEISELGVGSTNLIRTDATEMKISFKVARFGSDNAIIGGGETPNKNFGWTNGSYVIQGVAGGTPISFAEINFSTSATDNSSAARRAIANKRLNSDDTVEVIVPVNFDAATELAGKAVTFSVTPKLGASLGVTSYSKNTVSAWVGVATAADVTANTALTYTGNIIVDDKYGDEDGYWDYEVAGVVKSSLDPTVAADKLIGGLLEIDTWSNITGNDATLIASIRNLVTVKFSEPVDLEELEVDFSFKTDGNIRSGRISAEFIVDPNDETVVHVIGIPEGTRAQIDDFATEIALATELENVSITFSNIIGLDSGADFGYLYWTNKARGRSKVINDLEIQFGDIPIAP